MIYPAGCMPLQFAPLSLGFASRETMLMITVWYMPTVAPPPAGNDRYRDDFKWDNPRTQHDGELGDICEVSHAWFPASRLQTMQDGKKVGDAFAYRDRVFPDIEVETWGAPRE